MELKRFSNLFSRKMSERMHNALWYLKSESRGKGWALYQLYTGIRELERNVNRLEARVAELELRKDDGG